MDGWWIGAAGLLLGTIVFTVAVARRKPKARALPPPPPPPCGQAPERWNTESGKPTVRWGFGQACPRCGSRSNTVKTYRGRKVAGCRHCRTVLWYDASYDDCLPEIDDLMTAGFFLDSGAARDSGAVPFGSDSDGSFGGGGASGSYDSGGDSRGGSDNGSPDSGGSCDSGGGDSDSGCSDSGGGDSGGGGD